MELYAHKLSIPRSGNEILRVGTDISYQFHPKASLHFVGIYYWTRLLDVEPKKWLSGYHYGGYLTFDLAERWAMDVGMRSYSDNLSHQQWTVPIVRPSYEYNGSEINADLGGIVHQILRGLFF